MGQIKDLQERKRELERRLEHLREEHPGDKKKRRKKRLVRKIARLERRISGLQAGNSHRVVTRAEWGAAPRRANPGSMTSTSSGLFVHHTVANAPGLVARVAGSVRRAGVRSGLTAAERAEMRNLQRIAFSRDFSDISYSFVVMPSGRVYEGRGIGVVGAHTLNYNATAYGVAAAGNYDVNKPPEAMVQAYRWLRRQHLGLTDEPLRGHRDVYPTACPGKYLYARLGDI